MLEMLAPLKLDNFAGKEFKWQWLELSTISEAEDLEDSFSCLFDGYRVQGKAENTMLIVVKFI